MRLLLVALPALLLTACGGSGSDQAATKQPEIAVRSEEQIELQQFSTPAPVAYLAALAGRIAATDLVLEPSAGTGLLAVFAHRVGARLVLNEIDPARAAASYAPLSVGSRAPSSPEPPQARGDTIYMTVADRDGNRQGARLVAERRPGPERGKRRLRGGRELRCVRGRVPNREQPDGDGVVRVPEQD